MYDNNKCRLEVRQQMRKRQGNSPPFYIMTQTYQSIVSNLLIGLKQS